MGETAQSFSQNILETMMDNPKSTQGIFDLPCGYLDANGVLHTEVQVREMTGREEDLLASNKISPVKKINALLAACVVRLGSIENRELIGQAVVNMTQGDRVYTLLAVRMASLGNDYPVEQKCPECGVESNYLLDLGTLEKKTLAEPMIRVRDIELPSKKQARIRLATGADEERTAKVRDEEKPSMLLLCRTELLDGKMPTLLDIKNLSWRDRQALRSAMEDFDGGVDGTLEMTCNACNHEFKRDLDMGATGFFFPERALKALKQKSST